MSQKPPNFPFFDILSNCNKTFFAKKNNAQKMLTVRSYKKKTYENIISISYKA